MKVAIDISRVLDYGAGTYTRNLIDTLATLDRDNSYLLVGTLAERGELGDLPANFSLLEWDRQRRFGQEMRLGLRLRQQRVQLLHTPYLTAPWVMPCRHVLTVHDAVDFLHIVGDGHSLADTILFQRTRRALFRARRILAVSRATRRDLQQLFGVPGERIEVVYNALDARIAEPPSEDIIRRTLERYSVHHPYLLYAGNVKPHKNLSRLIEAFALVKDRLRDHPRYRALKLIIIGDELSRHAHLRRTVVMSRTQNDVRFLGFVDRQTLSVFYLRAEAFVFPSLYEGFGLPPLEAMSLGTPVITSNVSSLPEVLGDAAQFVNPEKVFDISRGIHDVLLNENLRAQLIERGREQVKRFSWTASVQRVLEVYRRAAA